MKTLLTIFTSLLIIFQSGLAQEKQVFIAKDALDSKSDVGKYCDLVSKKESLDRKTIYNLASNGIIARRIQNDHLKYTQVRYNHMLLKLFSDAYFNCKKFKTNYHYVFDAKNVENTQLVFQHQQFTTKLIEYIEKDKFLIKLTNPELPIFGYVKHLIDTEYSLSFYHYLPDNGPIVPNEINNRFAKYTFKLEGEEISLVNEEVNKKQIQKLRLSKANLVPPPPPPPKRN